MIFFTGGTLGHIMPCVTLIKEIKKRYKDIYIMVVATTKDTNYEILKSKEIDKIIYLECYKLSYNIKKQFINYKTYNEISKIIIENNFDVAYGFGGYISGIGIVAAKKQNLKTYIHEQNSVMGIANKLVARFVNDVFLSYPINNKRKNYHLVGSPVYMNALNIKKNIYKLKNKILFTSGTLGSKVINDFAVNLINNGYLDDFDIYLVTGKKYYEDVRKRLNKKNVKILPFNNDLIKDIASSEIVISRGGSSTLFEIIGTSTLSIIIPSPIVTNNHQYYNALYFYEKKFIEMIEEKDLSINNFMNKLHILISDKSLYINNMKNCEFDKIYEYMIEGVINE